MTYTIHREPNHDVAITVQAYRAQDVVGAVPIATATILIGEPIPAYGQGKGERQFFLDAEDIYRVLSETLPGGTLDQLFAVMCADRASVLRVPKVRPEQDGAPS